MTKDPKERQPSKILPLRIASRKRGPQMLTPPNPPSEAAGPGRWRRRGTKTLLWVCPNATSSSFRLRLLAGNRLALRCSSPFDVRAAPAREFHSGHRPTSPSEIDGSPTKTDRWSAHHPRPSQQER